MWNDNLTSFSSRPIHQKRKADYILEVTPPVKMHINEEKMVSQLKGIHLSSSYTPHGSNSTEVDTTFLDYVLDNSSKENHPASPSLTLCDELKSRFNPSFRFNSSMPNSILDRFNKQCTALVLWQPPPIGRTLTMPNDVNNGDKAEEPEPSSSAFSENQQEVVDVEMMDDDDDNNNSLRADADPANLRF